VILNLEFVKISTVIFSLPTGRLEFTAHAVTEGSKIQSRHHLAPHIKLRFPNFKLETLKINEVVGHFEGKVLMHYRYLGPFENKVQ